MWNIILMILKYGPSLITLIREIMKLIDDLSDSDKLMAHEELDAAFSAYRVTKDKRPLSELRDRLKKKCEGNRCQT